jgi:hypothetical protein
VPFGAEFRWRTPSVATATQGILRLIQHQNSSAPYPQIQYWQTTRKEAKPHYLDQSHEQHLALTGTYCVGRAGNVGWAFCPWSLHCRSCWSFIGGNIYDPLMWTGRTILVVNRSVAGAWFLLKVFRRGRGVQVTAPWLRRVVTGQRRIRLLCDFSCLLFFRDNTRKT